MSFQGNSGSKPRRANGALLRRLVLRALLLLSVSAGVLAPFVAPQAHAEATAMVAEGYARITLDLPRAARFNASVANGVLVVRFDRTVALDPAALARAMPDYISVARLDDGGRTLRAALKRGWRIHTSRNAAVLAIDLVSPDFSGDPPDIAPTQAEIEAAAAEAAAREDAARTPVDPATLPLLAVPVRVGEHSDYTRIVFDWPEAVDYALELDEGALTITFARGAELSSARLTQSPPPFVRGFAAGNEAGRLVVRMQVDPSSPIHHFRDGPKIALDIRSPRTDSEGGIVPMSAPEADRTGATAEAPPAAPPADVPPADAPPATEHVAEPAQADAAHADPAPADEAHAAAETGDAVHDEATPAPEPEAVAEAEPHAPPGTDAAAHASAEAEGTETAHPATEDAIAAAARNAASSPASSEATDGEALAHDAAAVPMELRAEVIGDGLRLEFPFGKENAAALFQRGRTFYVVFDGDAPFAVETLPERFFDFVTEASRMRAGDDTVIRLRLAGEPLATVSLEGMTWVLTLGPSVMETPLPVRLLREARTVGPSRVRAALTGASRVIAFEDPDAGDPLIVVTAFGAVQGLIAQRDFVEFMALETAQGLAIRPHTDDLTVTIEGAEALIESGGGLSLSAGTVSQYAPERKPLGDTLRPAFMDFSAWRVPAAAYAREHARLFNAIGDDAAGPSAARLALAQFYLAHGLSYEALGVLDILAADDERAVLDPTFLATRAVGRFLARDFAGAREDLATRALDSDPNAQLMRGLVAVALEDWPAARAALAAGEEWIGRYPGDWQARFRLATATTGLAVNDLGLAERALSAMPAEGHEAAQALEAKLLKGQLLARLDRTEAAMELFNQVAAGGNRPLEARAAFDILLLKARTGALPPNEAIAELERLSWRWRGDRLELQVLKALADLQIASGDYRNGLLTMRAAVLGFPNDPLARHVREDMARAFEDLFLNGKADALPPVQAVGLYYDFKELTPIGRLGDDMIRRLADRLVAVDLLAQATELLQYQVDNRLEGVARSAVATRLALVYLMDREPEKALDAIRSTRQTRLPDELLIQRRLLEARALAEMKQFQLAQETLEQDDSADARRLKADISWMASDWQIAAERFEKLATEAGTGAVDDITRVDVMRAVIAFTLANDARGLSRLREAYGARMEATSYGPAFDAVTRAIAPDTVAFRDLAKAVAAIDTLDRFLASFDASRTPGETAALDIP